MGFFLIAIGIGTALALLGCLVWMLVRLGAFMARAISEIAAGAREERANPTPEPEWFQRVCARVDAWGR